LKLSLTKLGLWATVAAVVLVLGAFRPGMAPERAEAAMAGMFSVPSSVPGLVPAFAPASPPGNIAVAVAVCDDPDPLNSGLCPRATTLLMPAPVPPLPFITSRALIFTLSRYHPSGDPAARFGANNGTTLICEEGAPCDLDVGSPILPLEPDGHVAVEVRGGGQNEVVEVQACDLTGDCRSTLIIFVETIFAVSPLHAAASFTPTMVSYACPVRAQVPVDPRVGDHAGIDGLADLQDTVFGSIPAFAAAGIIATNRLYVMPAGGSGFALPPDYGPKWRCGTAANSPQNRVTFETDAGILSVEAFVNPVTIGDGCDAGDSVDVIDYPGIPVDLAGLLAGVPPAGDQCDLDAFDAVVTYGLEGTGDVGVATVTAQQLGGAGPLRTINVTFVGLGALSLMMDVPDVIGMEGGEFSVVVVDPDLRFLEGQTLACTAEPKEAVIAIIPQTGTTGMFPEPFAYFTVYPTFAAVEAGAEVTITCLLASNPTVKAVATARLGTSPEETVDLVAGCNPVSATWPDGTAASDVAAAVAPEDALNAIWAFDTASGTWLGYSAEFPEQSDLTSVDRLQAFFICVDADATVSRPVI